MTFIRSDFGITFLLLLTCPFSDAWVLQPTTGATAPKRDWARNTPVCFSSVEVDQESSSESNPNESNADEDAAHQAFLARCKALCDLRNLPLEKVKNARDLTSVQNSPIKPNRLFRMGRVSDATEKDIEILFDDLQMKTLVDLRSPTELKEDETLMRPEVYANYTTIVYSERRAGGCVRVYGKNEEPLKKRSFRFWSQDGTTTKVVEEEEEEEEDDACQDPAMVYDADRKERHFVSIMNELKYVKGTVSKLRKRDITKALLKSPGALVSRRVRTSVKKPFLDEINGGGLQMVNDLLLQYGAPGIKYVLELCSDRNRHPIGFYCTAGKDRTGVISAIILRLIGVPTEDIVEDYTLSANVYAEMNDHKAMVGALSQRSLNPKTFLSAPPEVMRDTIESIEEKFGSVEGYLEWIGFGPELQQKLKDAVLED